MTRAVGLTGSRALELLEQLALDDVEALPDAEARELCREELAVESTPANWERAARVADREKTGVNAAADIKKRLEGLESGLRSDLHRLWAGAQRLAEEERERARLRRLLGALTDPRERVQLDAIRQANRRGMHCAPPGSRLLITVEGLRVRDALSYRIERFGDRPLTEFLGRSRKVDAKMRAFAQDARRIFQLELPGKNKVQLVTGLIKAGYDADTARAAFQHGATVAHGTVPPKHIGSAAVTVLRAAPKGAGERELADAGGRLRAADEALARRMGRPVDELLGLGKWIAPCDDLDAAAGRFLSIANELMKLRVPAPLALRWAGRLAAAAGTPTEVAARCQQAAEEAQPGRQERTIEISDAAVSLAAMTRDANGVHDAANRLRAIGRELHKQGAMHESMPAAAVPLLACAGTPAEAVNVVHDLVRHLDAADHHTTTWGKSSWFEMACGFAKRFAY